MRCRIFKVTIFRGWVFFLDVHLQKGTCNIKGNCEVIATSGPHFLSFSNDAKGNWRCQKGSNGRDTVHVLLATSLESDQLQLWPALFMSAHLAITDAPIIRTAAKSQAKINIRRSAAINSRCYALSLMIPTVSAIREVDCSTGRPESQQPTESQITRICMEIYLTMNKMVKMYKNT